MDAQTLVELANWFKGHPGHLEDAEDCSPSQLVFRFLCYPEDLIDYEDPYDRMMISSQRAMSSCQYAHRTGPQKGAKCGCESTSFGGMRCTFHSHPIFSDELRERIDRLAMEMNGTSNGLLDSLVPYHGNLYRDERTKLVYRLQDQVPVCIGYAPGDQIFPLTPKILEQAH